MSKLKYSDFLYIFLIASIFGWILEGILTLVVDGELINHSAVVIGPINAIYGFGACALTALLVKFKDKSLIYIFIMSLVCCSLLEYFMSWGMEFALGFSAWDYSDLFLNINGRVCLLYSLAWGILGILWIKLIYPLLKKMIDKIDPNFSNVFACLLSLFLIFDIALTTSAFIRAQNFDKGIPPKNSYEKFLDKTFNRDYLKNMFNNSWK